MKKVVIMYRTAIYAQNERTITSSFAIKASCDELIDKFNNGKHIIDDENDENCYAILNT